MQLPFLFLILDGFGYADPGPYNPFGSARMPYWSALLSETKTQGVLEASGPCVGLPEGQMGNSEVGHMTLGAGRALDQSLVRIDKALASGQWPGCERWRAQMRDHARKGHPLHVMGLLSEGGVHAHTRHWWGFLEELRRLGCSNLRVHAFLDGRDVPPRSARASLEMLEQHLMGLGSVATVLGRYYAMDRDRRVERTELAYRAIAHGKAPYHAASALEALESAYARGETDEFVMPTCIASYEGGIGESDALLMMNFRADRMRQIASALLNEDFSEGASHARPLQAWSLTAYAPDLPMHVLFPDQKPQDLLAEIWARAQLRQLRLAETEKYAHVTYFFNGGIEEPFPLEYRRMIPSPKVDYASQPEMSLPELEACFLEECRGNAFDVAVVNIANADMVGHTGNMQSAVAALEAIDAALSRMLPAVLDRGGQVLITADHGNIECMYDAAHQQPHTAHTHQKVPWLYLGRPASVLKVSGDLRDCAPSILSALDLDIPVCMEGESLLGFFDKSSKNKN